MALIRAAKLEDAAAIAHVHVRSWRTTYAGIIPDEYLTALNEAERVPLWEDWLTSDISLFVAEIEGKVVGFAGGGAIREPIEAYDAELYTLYLLEEAQGRGLGRALVTTVAETLARKGFQSIVVWALEQNPAVRFYEKAGAQRVTSKQIEIGGRLLPDLALGWPDLTRLLRSMPDTALPGEAST